MCPPAMLKRISRFRQGMLLNNQGCAGDPNCGREIDEAGVDNLSVRISGRVAGGT